MAVLEFLPICDGLFNMISLAIYFCDIVFDILTLYTFHQQQLSTWFTTCLVFVLLSVIISQFVSLNLMFGSGKQDTQRHDSHKWCTIVIHLSLCGVLWRYFKLFLPVNIKYVKQDVRDLCILRMIHAFCEASPMLLIQLYLIWFKTDANHLTNLNIVSTTLSLLSVCWALSSFSKHISQQNVDRLVLTWIGIICQLLWRLGTVVSRVVALTVYATIYKQWVLLVLGMHWVCMLLWIASSNNVFIMGKSTASRRAVVSCVFAVVYTMCFVNIYENNPRLRMLAYYVIMFLENTLLVAVWLISVNGSPFPLPWYQANAITCVFLGFGFGLLFAVVYYRYLHIRRLRTFYSSEVNHDGNDNIKCNMCSLGKCSQHPPNMQRSAIAFAATNAKMAKKYIHSNGQSTTNQIGNPHENASGNPHMPGVFNCRFNPAIKRKKKKPSSFVPPPIPIFPSIGNVLSGRSNEPFWKRGFTNLKVCDGDQISVASSRVNIQEKLMEKKLKQLAALQDIEEEIRQGKLQRPSVKEQSDLQEPIPLLKKQPLLLDEDPSHYASPFQCKVPEVLLTPHHLQNCQHSEYHEPHWICGNQVLRHPCGHCQNSAASNGYSNVSSADKYKSYRLMPSDIDSQLSLPRSYTMPREFKYKRRQRKMVKVEHFVPSTNSSDGDVDSCEETSPYHRPQHPQHLTNNCLLNGTARCHHPPKLKSYFALYNSAHLQQQGSVHHETKL